MKQFLLCFFLMAGLSQAALVVNVGAPVTPQFFSGEPAAQQDSLVAQTVSNNVTFAAGSATITAFAITFNQNCRTCQGAYFGGGAPLAPLSVTNTETGETLVTQLLYNVMVASYQNNLLTSVTFSGTTANTLPLRFANGSSASFAVAFSSPISGSATTTQTRNLNLTTTYVPANAVPEPGSVSLALGGLLLMACGIGRARVGGFRQAMFSRRKNSA